MPITTRRTSRFLALLFTCALAGVVHAQAPVPSSPTAPKTGSGPGPYTVQAAVPETGGVRAVRAVVSLRTSLTSKNAPEGKEIKTILERAVTLPDGTVLPRNTVIGGVVAHSSPHSKQKPNGALMLLFDQALSRPDAPPLRIVSKMRELSSQGDDTVALPGARLGGTSNAGGTEQLNFEANNRGQLTSNIKSSGLNGILLDATAPGSGVLYAVDGDVYLDSGTQITLVMASAPPAVAPPSKP